MNSCLFLPWNTPSSIIAESAAHLYHPMSLPKQGKKTGIIKMPNGFIGAGAMSYGTTLGMNTVIVINPRDCLATHSLKECINHHVSIDDPFAEVEVVQSWQLDIAGQLDDVLIRTDYTRILLLWPYQTLSLSKVTKLPSKDVEFTYMHKNMSPKAKLLVSEAMAVSVVNNEEDEVVCKNASSVGTIPDLIKASYSRLISSVYINREQWVAFRDSGADDISVSAFLAESLKGKSGCLADPNVFEWVI